MATTMEIINATELRLRAKLPSLAVEYFPEKPGDYRLNHPKGALLISYAGSRYDETKDISYVAQPRALRLAITVMMRQLHGRNGAVEAVDLVRRALLGWRPPDCRKAQITADKYLGETAGIWQYAVDFTAQSMVVEDTEVNTEKPLTKVTYEESDT